MGEAEQTGTINAGCADEAALMQSLDRLLEGITRRKVQIFISAALVDHLVLPGLEHWLKDDDLIALARSRLASFYGTDQSRREVVVSRGNYGAPCLAVSMSKNLLGGIRAVAAARKVRLIGVFPSAALAVKALGRELNAPTSTAIWLEDSDSFWIGFREKGHWLATRGVAANVLRHATRPDILQREHLSAGLPAVDRICFGALNNTQVPDEWRQSAIVFADHIHALAAQPSALNFLNERKNKAGWLLLLVALVMLAATLYVWSDRQHRYADVLASVTQSNVIADKASDEGRRTLASFEEDYHRATSAYRFQMAPWGELFTALNESGGTALGLTVLKADAIDGSLTLEGEATRFDDIQAFVDKLAENPLLRDGKVTSMQPGGDSSAGRVRFSLGIHWVSTLLSTETIKP